MLPWVCCLWKWGINCTARAGAPAESLTFVPASPCSRHGYSRYPSSQSTVGISLKAVIFVMCASVYKINTKPTFLKISVQFWPLVQKTKIGYAVRQTLLFQIAPREKRVTGTKLLFNVPRTTGGATQGGLSNAIYSQSRDKRRSSCWVVCPSASGEVCEGLTGHNAGVLGNTPR